MEPIDDLDALRDALRKLVERRLVVYLTPEGRRGTILSHGFHSPEELTALRRSHPAENTSCPPTTSSHSDTISADLDDARKQIADLRTQVADLQGALAQVTRDVQELKRSLGV
jgi:hypothetical protein